MKNKLNNELNNLINKILCLSGNKIITLSSDGDFKIDIDKNNKIGYAPEHEYLFKTKLVNAMQYGGGMIIRQFLSLRVKRKSFIWEKFQMLLDRIKFPKAKICHKLF